MSLTLVLLPAVLAAVLLVLHVGLVRHARSLVHAAAAEALIAASVEGGTEASARAAAETTLSLAPGLTSGDVDVDLGERTVTVTVTATVAGPLPVADTFSVTVSGPVERFRSVELP